VQQVTEMRRAFYASGVALLLAAFINNVQAQGFVNDNDGLLDVGEAAGFPDDPTGATGELLLTSRGIQDLDGTSLLTNLQTLYLGGNPITSVEPGDFDGLTNLQTLNLNFNAIASIESGDFDGLANLQTLNLGCNAIRSVEQGDFDGLTNLQTLDLRSNDITSVESGGFYGLTNLQTLYLWDNDIASVEPGDFDGLANLQTLNLEFNDITSVEPGAFKGLTNLETLFLYGNDLTELNLTAATFDHLQRGQLPEFITPGFGFVVDSSEITLLVLDDAKLSRDSFDAIVEQTISIVDASLVGLTFTDSNPSNVSALLGIPTLNDVRLDPSLYSLYAAEFDNFAATAGNTLTIVPEPTTCTLALVSLCLAMSRRRSF
jgi:Leucine-rich repeat (LRR) protein